MAKKKTTKKEVSEVVDPLAEKVRNLRSLGYDNNKIAAMLMVSRHTVDNIL